VTHVTHSYVWHDSCTCVRCLTRMYVCHDSGVTHWLIHVTHSYVWHDSSICVTWPTY